MDAAAAAREARHVDRATRSRMAQENLRFPPHLVEQPRHMIERAAAQSPGSSVPLRCWRSRYYLVVLWQDGECEAQRLQVQRTILRPDGGWEDGITWDTLEAIKSEIGYGDRWAVEVYPPDAHVLDVANMRHLWLLPGAPAYGWVVPGEKP